MDAGEFIDRTMSELDIDERSDARSAVRAVLNTFGERISREDALNISEQLPEGIEQYLSEADHGQEFTRETFLDYVIQREDMAIDRDTARRHSQAILGIVADIVDDMEMENVRDDLPSSFDVLFTG